MSIYLRDISQAYVQSTTYLNRQIFIRPPLELRLSKDTILRVIKPLYRVPKAGNHWFRTYHDHYTQQLKITQLTYNPCLLYTSTNGFGLVGLQTDDTLFLADLEFARNEETQLQKAKFLAKDREQLITKHLIKFNKGQINLQEDNSIRLTQERQAQNLRLVLVQKIDLTSSRGDTRKSVSPKDQYVAQRAQGAYIATVCQLEATFDLSFTA